MGGSRTWGSASEATEAVADVPPRRDDLEPGSVVGRYQVEAPVGSGGMGVVVAARDPELDRPVAIKIMHDADALGERWLRREAQALAQLNHPNIVEVLDVGMVNERPFIAMEFIEGVTLRAWLDAAPRSPKDVLTVFAAAGRGLAAAHAANIVHCDFKPSNVMMHRGAGETMALADAVRIMDFGLARHGAQASETEDDALPSSASLSADFTGFGKVRGTPKYMAPEQFALEEVGPPADQFAFCIALYEALWGAAPFPDETPAARMASRLNGTRAERPPASRSQRALVDTVLRGLEPKPSDRWPSMDALVAALHPPRRTWVWGAGVAAVVALGGVAAGLATEDDRCVRAGSALASTWNPDERESIGAAFQRTGRPFATDLWQTGLEEIDGWAGRWSAAAEANCRATYDDGEQSERDHDARLLCLERQANTFETVLAGLGTVDADSVGRALNTIALLPDPAACTTDAELPMRPDDPRRAAELDQAHAAVDRCRVLTAAGDAALTCTVDALEQAEALGDAHLIFEARRAHVVAVEGSGRRDEAMQLAEALYFDAQAAGQTRVATDMALRLAFIHATAHMDAVVARQWLRRADPIRETDGGAARYARNAALVEVAAKNHDAAIARAREAVALEERTGTRSNLGKALNTLGVTLIDARKYEEGREVYERALEVHRSATGRSHDLVATAHNNLGHVLMRMGEVEASLPSFERALEIRRGILPAEHRHIATATANVGETHARLGRYDRALPFYVESADVFEAVEGRKSTDHTRMRLRVATALRELGRFTEAREAVDIALDGCGHQPLEHIDRFQAEVELARLKEASGDDEAAIAFFESTREASLTPSQREFVAQELERLRAG